MLLSGNERGEIYELDTPITLTYKLSEKLQSVPEGYTRKFYIIRLHWDNKTGKMVVEKLPATQKGDTISAENDKFSYFLVAYEDTVAEEERGDEKESEEATTNPNTFDRGGLAFATVAGTSIPLILWGAYLATKRN